MKNQPIKHSPKMEKCIAEKMSDLLQFIDDISGLEKTSNLQLEMWKIIIVYTDNSLMRSCSIWSNLKSEVSIIENNILS